MGLHDDVGKRVDVNYKMLESNYKKETGRKFNHDDCSWADFNDYLDWLETKVQEMYETSENCNCKSVTGDTAGT